MKRSRPYSVTVSASDGNGGSDSITVTVNVTDVNENNAQTEQRHPCLAMGQPQPRSIAENTVANVNIGTAVSATDADTGDTLTYTLGGTDAASFRIACPPLGSCRRVLRWIMKRNRLIL